MTALAVVGREEPRTLAPPGRRPAAVVEVERRGAYRVIWVSDREGPPDPWPGQFYMLAAARWGGEDGRPYLPRAFSHARVLSSESGPPERSLRGGPDAGGPQA